MKISRPGYVRLGSLVRGETSTSNLCKFRFTRLGPNFHAEVILEKLQSFGAKFLRACYFRLGSLVWGEILTPRLFWVRFTCLG